MRSKLKKKSSTRTFERAARLKRLLDAGVIQSADEIPDDAIPVSLDFMGSTQGSYRLHGRPPYYQDIKFRCEDCGQDVVWAADDQRFWYEQLHGSPYSTAKRCGDCRRKRKGISK
jgi:hypothetical protein